MQLYSKQSKIAEELFPWLQQRKSIINPDHSTKYANPLFGDIPHTKGNFKFFRESIEESHPLKKSQKPQPFSKQVGRKSPKRSPDRYGFYQPKYHLVSKRSPLMEQSLTHFSSKSRSPSIHNNSNKKIPLNTLNISTSSSDFVSKPLGKPKGYVSFSKMAKIERFPLDEGPNEKRFEAYEYPQSQYPRRPNMKITQEQRKIKKGQRYGQIYDKNYESIYPKSAKMIPNFNLVSARKEFGSEKQIYTVRQTLYEDKPNDKSFSIDKQISREKAQSHYNSIRRLYQV